MAPQCQVEYSRCSKSHETGSNGEFQRQCRLSQKPDRWVLSLKASTLCLYTCAPLSRNSTSWNRIGCLMLSSNLRTGNGRASPENHPTRYIICRAPSSLLISCGLQAISAVRPAVGVHRAPSMCGIALRTRCEAPRFRQRWYTMS